MTLCASSRPKRGFRSGAACRLGGGRSGLYSGPQAVTSPRFRLALLPPQPQLCLSPSAALPLRLRLNSPVSIPCRQIPSWISEPAAVANPP